MERIKFCLENTQVMDEGVALLTSAYRMFKSGKMDKTTAIEKARRNAKSRKDIPVNDSLIEYLTTIDTLMEKGERLPETARRSAKTCVINGVIANLKGEKPAEEVPGQLQMELTVAPEPKPVEGIQLEIDQAKMMRFLAGQVDKLYMKLDTINNTLCMILRAVRKE